MDPRDGLGLSKLAPDMAECKAFPFSFWALDPIEEHGPQWHPTCLTVGGVPVFILDFGYQRGAWTKLAPDMPDCRERSRFNSGPWIPERNLVHGGTRHA